MAFTIYLHREQFQPEEPQILDSHVRKDTLFTFVDFVPSIIKRSSTSIITAAEIEYHSFRDMIITANKWLDRNAHLHLVNCETIRVLFKYNDCGNYYELRPNDVSHYVYGSEKNNILRVLRLWVRKKEQPDVLKQLVSSDLTTTHADAGYCGSSVQSEALANKCFAASDSVESTSSEPANFVSTLRSDSGDSATCDVSKDNSNNSNNIINNNNVMPAISKQHRFRLQQQTSQQQFQSTQPAANTSSTSGDAGSMTVSSCARIGRQPMLHRQMSVPPTLSPKCASNKGTKTTVKCDWLDYVDIVPECNDNKCKDNATSGSIKMDKFERLDDCVRRLNDMLSTNRAPGRLLCVETVADEASIDWKIQTERNFTEFSSKTVLFLRCYFQPNLTIDTNEQVGIIDFIPCHLSGGGFFKRPKFEHFTQVLARSTEWLAEHPQCNFKNSQTLDIKLKSQFSPSAMQICDSRQMWFTEHGDYLKIFRVIYTISTADLFRTAEQTLKNGMESTLNLNQLQITTRPRISSVDSAHVEMLNKSAFVLNLRNQSNKQRSYSQEAGDGNTCSDSNEQRPSTSGSGSDSNSNRHTKLWIDNQFGRPIYLSSKIFLAQKTSQTINDLRETIQEWYNTLEKEYRDLSAQSGMHGLQRTRILSAETMQVYAKQEPGKGGELANLHRLGEQPFMYNRFGAKNGYLISVFRVYFDIGWFAWERLGYARGHRQKRSLLKRLNAIAARPPPDINAEPVVLQQSQTQSSLVCKEETDSNQPISSNISMITVAGSESDASIMITKNLLDSNQTRRTSEDTGVETMLDYEDEVEYDSDGDPTTTTRSISELHGSDNPSEITDNASCVILTGGLSSLSLLASTSDSSFFVTGNSTRHGSLKRPLYRNSSVGSTGSSNSSNCLLM